MAVLTLLLAPCLFSPATAHQGLHARIDRLSSLIASEPRNAELLLKRAELHRIHRAYTQAATDYARARAIDPELRAVDLAEARMLLEADRPASSLPLLDRFLRHDTTNPDAYILKARALAKLEECNTALLAWDRALSTAENAGTARPELYISRARHADSCSAGQRGHELALQGLERGLAVLGSVPTLELAALELERNAGFPDRALARLDRLSKASPRPELWITRKGELLESLQRLPEARAAYEQALRAIDTLPPTQQSIPSVARLRLRIETQLQSLR